MSVNENFLSSGLERFSVFFDNKDIVVTLNHMDMSLHFPPIESILEKIQKNWESQLTYLLSSILTNILPQILPINSGYLIEYVLSSLQTSLTTISCEYPSNRPHVINNVDCFTLIYTLIHDIVMDLIKIYQSTNPTHYIKPILKINSSPSMMIFPLPTIQKQTLDLQLSYQDFNPDLAQPQDTESVILQISSKYITSLQRKKEKNIATKGKSLLRVRSLVKSSYIRGGESVVLSYSKPNSKQYTHEYSKQIPDYIEDFGDVIIPIDWFEGGWK